MLGIWLAVFGYEKLYMKRRGIWEETRTLVRSASIASAFVLLVMTFTRTQLIYSRWVIVLAWAFSLILLPLSRRLVKTVLFHLNLWKKRVIIIGSKDSMASVIRSISQNRILGYQISGSLTEDRSLIGSTIEGVDVLGHYDDIEIWQARTKFEDIVIAFPDIPGDRLIELIRRWDGVAETLRFVPRTGELITSGVEIENIGRIMSLTFRKNLLKPWNILIKAAFDFLASVILLVPFTALGLIIAAAVKFDSAGPVIFTQARFGKRGRPIKIIKFRSMRIDADARLEAHLRDHPEAREEWAQFKKLRNGDPRVTRVGGFLRRHSLDELPQILNVLFGQMSLVGPRPYIEEELAEVQQMKSVLGQARPGITGALADERPLEHLLRRPAEDRRELHPQLDAAHRPDILSGPSASSSPAAAPSESGTLDEDRDRRPRRRSRRHGERLLYPGTRPGPPRRRPASRALHLCHGPGAPVLSLAREPGRRAVIRELKPRTPLLRIPVSLALASRRDALDVLHVQYIGPPVHRGRLVATIHDLGFLRVPATFSRTFVTRSKVLVRRTARRAARVITGSAFSRDDLIAEYGLDPGRSGRRSRTASGRNISPPRRASAAEAEAVLARHGIRRPYILSVGRLNPRKNLPALAGAFARMKKATGLPHRLVLAGPADYRTKETLAAVSAAVPDVLVAGLVPDRDLPLLYREAEIFVYPSLFEGGGLPALEAMAAGTPVIASKTSSLPEMVGDAGILIDPESVDDIARALTRLAADPELRRTLREKGRARARSMTWENAARATLRVYEEAGRARNEPAKKLFVSVGHPLPAVAGADDLDRPGLHRRDLRRMLEGPGDFRPQVGGVLPEIDPRFAQDLAVERHVPGDHEAARGHGFEQGGVGPPDFVAVDIDGAMAEELGPDARIVDESGPDEPRVPGGPDHPPGFRPVRGAADENELHPGFEPSRRREPSGRDCSPARTG